jgi:hypothetical protein
VRDRPGDAAQPGGRARPGQRRPGAPGRLLHRLAGHHERSLYRLRHPLRVRHLPPDLRGRPPGRAARHVAAARLAVGVPAPRGVRAGELRRSHREVHRRRRRREVALGPRLERARRALQLHGPGLPQRPRQHAAAVERAGHQRVRPADLQLRRLRPGRPRPDVRREHLQGALPRGLDAAGQGAAAAAAVLLRRRVAARLHQQGAGGELRPPPAARADRLPAQRHPPGDRGARADAHPGGREGLRLGRGVGHHQPLLRLHLPHAAARGPRGVADRPARTPAAAPPGDHLPDQRGVPRPGARAVPRRRAAGPPHVDHRRAARARRPDGLPGHRRGDEGQRRRRAAQPAAARQGAAGLLARCTPTSSPTSPTV